MSLVHSVVITYYCTDLFIIISEKGLLNRQKLILVGLRSLREIVRKPQLTKAHQPNLERITTATSFF
jgi:hypothetical protein